MAGSGRQTNLGWHVSGIYIAAGILGSSVTGAFIFRDDTEYNSFFKYKMSFENVKKIDKTIYLS